MTGAPFFIKTFGCQMNENDSERIAGLLAAAGGTRAARLEDSRIVVVNTCAVRAKSEEKLFSFLGRLRSWKNKQAGLLVVAGCVAQLHREKILERNPDVDLVLGPDTYHLLPRLIASREPGQRVWTAVSRRWSEELRGPAFRESPVSAFITVMEGCDRFCAYCVVPFTRGREKYRPLSAILDEARVLAAGGYREVQFLGQNVLSYRDPETGASFTDLLAKADGIDGLAWIRFLTSHPKNFSTSLAETIARSRHICHDIHLPLQSGSSAVLARMNRGYTAEEYLEKIRDARRLLPDVSLSTDIIVGFPGETEDEFAETIRALETIRFANIFSFRYSPRPRTAASRFDDDVSPEVKRRRLLEVQRLQKTIQTELHRTFVGRTIDVLCSGRSKKDGAVFSGRSEGRQVVNFHSPEDVVGRFARVLITDCGPYSLRGTLIQDFPQ